MPDEPRERPFILQWRSAVLNAPLTGTQKLCLLVLAEWADGDGKNCWPAMESIAEKASVNEKTVRLALEVGARNGWIHRSHRRTSKGWKKFDFSLLLPIGADSTSCRTADAPDMVSAATSDVPGTVSATQAHAPDQVSGTKQVGKACTGHPVHLHRTLTPDVPGTVSDDLALDLSKDLALKDLSSGNRFSEFWKIYPRKDAKQAAEKSWRRQKLDHQADRILADVQARIADPGQWVDPKFIPHGSTYLNQARWNDAWTPAAAKSVGAIERDARTDEEIERANKEQLAKFGLEDAA